MSNAQVELSTVTHNTIQVQYILRIRNMIRTLERHLTFCHNSYINIKSSFIRCDIVTTTF